MNTAERVAQIMGGKSKLAQAAEVHGAMVTRWVKIGEIPSKYRIRIIRNAQTICTASQMQELSELLPATVCPLCRQPLPVI